MILAAVLVVYIWEREGSEHGGVPALSINKSCSQVLLPSSLFCGHMVGGRQQDALTFAPGVEGRSHETVLFCLFLSCRICLQLKEHQLGKQAEYPINSYSNKLRAVPSAVQ